MSMSREEYEERAQEIMDYFYPGKEVKYLRRTITMMSVDAGHPSQIAPITHDQLPIIQCEYIDNNGCIMEKSIHWSSLETMRVMNNDTPLEKPPTVEYVDRG